MVGSCLMPDPGVVMSFGQIAYCIVTMLFGDILFAAIVFLALCAFVAIKFRIPLQAAFPASVVLLFGLASAGLGVGEAFFRLFWLWIVVLGVFVVMGVLTWARR
jgi:hypothetical protein